MFPQRRRTGMSYLYYRCIKWLWRQFVVKSDLILISWTINASSARSRSTRLQPVRDELQPNAAPAPVL